MLYMRTLFMIFVLHMTPALATELAEPPRQFTTHTWAVRTAPAPQTVVAQTGYPHPETITLLTDLCDARTGTMRAQWVTRDRTVIWGCWGYNPTGVIVQWSSGRSEYLDWFILYHLDQTTPRQLGYQRLHERVAFLRSQK
jgi:hypothetical protein